MRNIGNSELHNIWCVFGKITPFYYDCLRCIIARVFEHMQAEWVEVTALDMIIPLNIVPMCPDAVEYVAADILAHWLAGNKVMYKNLSPPSMNIRIEVKHSTLTHAPKHALAHASSRTEWTWN